MVYCIQKKKNLSKYVRQGACSPCKLMQLPYVYTKNTFEIERESQTKLNKKKIGVPIFLFLPEYFCFQLPQNEKKNEKNKEIKNKEIKKLIEPNNRQKGRKEGRKEERKVEGKKEGMTRVAQLDIFVKVGVGQLKRRRRRR